MKGLINIISPSIRIIACALLLAWPGLAESGGRGGTVTPDSVKVTLDSIERKVLDGESVTLSRMTVTVEARSKDVSHIVFSIPSGTTVDLSKTIAFNPNYSVELTSDDPSIAKINAELHATGVKLDGEFKAGTRTAVTIVTAGTVGYSGGEPFYFKSARFAFAGKIEAEFRDVDLSVRLEASIPNVKAGETVTYTVKIANLGTAATVSATAVEIVFSGTFRADEVAVTPGGTVGHTQQGIEAIIDREIASGATATVSVTGTWDPASVGDNSVSVTVRNPDDLTIENNSAEVAVFVNPVEGGLLPVFTVKPPDQVLVNRAYAVATAVENKTPYTAHNVVYAVTAVAAAGSVEIRDIVASVGTVEVTADGFVVRVDSLKAAETVSVTYTVTAREEGEYTLVTSVKADGYVEVREETTLTAVTAVRVTANAMPTVIYEAANTVSYTFEVANNDPDLELVTDLAFTATLAPEDGATLVDSVITWTDAAGTREIQCRSNLEGTEILCPVSLAPSSKATYTASLTASLNAGVESASLTWSTKVAGAVAAGKTEVRSQATLTEAAVTAKAATVESGTPARMSVSVANTSQELTLIGEVVATVTSSTEVAFSKVSMVDVVSGAAASCRLSVDQTAFDCAAPVKMTPETEVFYEVQATAVLGRAATEGSYTVSGGFRTNGVTQAKEVTITVTKAAEPPPPVCEACDPQDPLACAATDGLVCGDSDGDGQFCCEAPPPNCVSCDPNDQTFCSRDGSLICGDSDGDGKFCCEAR